MKIHRANNSKLKNSEIEREFRICNCKAEDIQFLMFNMYCHLFKNIRFHNNGTTEKNGNYYYAHDKMHSS